MLQGVQESLERLPDYLGGEFGRGGLLVKVEAGARVLGAWGGQVGGVLGELGEQGAVVVKEVAVGAEQWSRRVVVKVLKMAEITRDMVMRLKLVEAVVDTRDVASRLVEEVGATMGASPAMEATTNEKATAEPATTQAEPEHVNVELKDPKAKPDDLTGASPAMEATSNEKATAQPATAKDEPEHVKEGLKESKVEPEDL